VQFYLEDLLGQPVDLVTDKALREELRPFIEREAVKVWWRKGARRVALLLGWHGHFRQKGPDLYSTSGTGRVRRQRTVYDATLRNLELIGEAATHIPTAIREANPDIPWRLIVATRNPLVHA
jgi:hypothetical protein